MTVSLWNRDRPPAARSTDVLVIGGGVCGVSAALALERAGVETLLLERHALGSGASTRNAGFLMRGFAENYAAAGARLGREMAGFLWRWTEENLALLRGEGIESLPSYRRLPSCLLALGAPEYAALRESLALLREDGFEAEWIESGQDAPWRSGAALGGLINPGDAVCDPRALLTLLAGKLRHQPIEHEEVIGIEAVGGGVEARTPGLLVRAGRVLVCTNAYAGGLLPSLAGIVVPRRGQMLALRAPGERLDLAYYANFGSEYFRDAGGGVLVFGGCRAPFGPAEIGETDAVTHDVQEAIETFAVRVLGRRYPVAARWAGIMGFSPDGLPLVGPVDREERVWFCGGFTGHGMSMAFNTARGAVAEMLGGAKSPFPLSRHVDTLDLVEAGRPA